jgi:uncharacterized protein
MTTALRTLVALLFAPAGLGSPVVAQSAIQLTSQLGAWFGAILVGISLGLLGSGGAILTVPILTLLAGHDEKSAIVESLAIVGSIALVGAIRAALARRVDLSSAALLALPGLVGTTAGAHASQFVHGGVQLTALAILMLAAAALMLRPKRSGQDVATTVERSRVRLGVEGFSLGLGLGFVTGFVGVGGGFLIVPVLIAFRKTPLSLATGTSLAVIAFNCSVGLAKYLAQSATPNAAGPQQAAITVDWTTVAVFSALGILGSLLGGQWAGKLPEQSLRRGFAAFLVLVALAMAVRQWS